MKIIVDIFGADKSPDEIVKGCIEAIAERDGLELVLSGDEDKINAELAKYSYDKSKIEILDAKDVVTNDDVPTSAIKIKKESSLVKALEALKARDDIEGMLSCGSTGAVLTGGILKVGRIKGIMRPALAPVLPTLGGKEVCLVDCGANVDCRPEFLVHFALLGSTYMKCVFGVENPRVALVSVGDEDKKGNELTKAVFQLLEKAPINFVGNMEARYALTDQYDVLVADGFVGNVLLKSVEGTASMVMKSLKNAIMGSTSAKIGSLFMKKAFGKLKNDMDYHGKGGAPFLGVEKILIKGHGSSNAKAVKVAIYQIMRMVESKLVDSIKSGIADFSAIMGSNGQPV